MTAFGKKQATVSEDGILDETVEAKRPTSGQQNITSNESNTNAGNGGMVLPFTPLAMSFDSINYYVDMPAVRIVLLYKSKKDLYALHIYSQLTRQPGLLFL